MEEKPNGKVRGKALSLTARARPRAAAARTAHSAHRGTGCMCKGTQQNFKGIIYVTATKHSFFR